MPVSGWVDNDEQVPSGLSWEQELVAGALGRSLGQEPRVRLKV